MEPVAVQLYSFLGTVLCGFILGILFDGYRIFRMICRPKKILTVFGDLCFGLFAALSVFLLLIYSNWGEFRFYIFVGMLCGWFFYYKCFSKWLVALVIKFFRKIKRGMRGLKRRLRKIIKR